MKHSIRVLQDMIKEDKKRIKINTEIILSHEKEMRNFADYINDCEDRIREYENAIKRLKGNK